MSSNLYVKATIIIAAVLSLALVSSCGSSPKRDAYAGEDLVGEVSAAQIIGQWRLTILNPIAEENKQQITFAFNEGGVWQSKIIPSAEQNTDLGPMEFQGHGVWRVQGDKLYTKSEKVEEITGNKLGGFMLAIINASLSKSEGFVNPYEVSSNKIIWVHEETGQASLLERL